MDVPQAGLFSAVSSAFIIDVQSKLEPDPNDLTAAYLRILIHNMNNSLFPDADPGSTTWNGPPPEIVTVQSLLYASLTASLFAAFLAMLGKQWVNRYLRNRGGSAADKSRDRQQKLDGLEKWRFRLTIESLPVMLQLALLLLGCALSRYLWLISRTVAGVVVAVTLFGVTSYVFLTLAATFYPKCPYQTPPSIFTRALVRYLTCSNHSFARSLRSLMAPFPSVKDLRRIIRHLRSGARRALTSLGGISGVPEETEHMPLAVVTSAAAPTRIYEDVPIDWEVYKADTRCISWILHSTTDADVIYSTARFAGDMIWYPEAVGALSPHILASLFFDCLLDGEAAPGKSEHAISIGMALASVLSTQFITEPDSRVYEELQKNIQLRTALVSWSEPKFNLVAGTLKSILISPTSVEFLWDAPDNFSVTQKLWLSRIILQNVWRQRRIEGPTGALEISGIEYIFKTSTADNNKTISILKTNNFLTMAIVLGLQIDIRDLYAPNTKCVVPPQSPKEFTHQMIAKRWRRQSTFSVTSYKRPLRGGRPTGSP